MSLERRVDSEVRESSRYFKLMRLGVVFVLTGFVATFFAITFWHVVYFRYAMIFITVPSFVLSVGCFVWMACMLVVYFVSIVRSR